MKPETINMGYVYYNDLDNIDRLVQSVLDRERIFKNEKDVIDNIYHNVRICRRISSRSNSNISMES